MTVEELRAEFPILTTHAYMNHAGVGPLPRRAHEAVGRASRRLMEEPYPDGWAQQEAAELRSTLGAVFNAPAHTFAITRSTAHGISLLAAGLDWLPGDQVVLARGEYPANVYPWMAQRHRGMEVVIVEPEAAGVVTAERLLEACGPRTRVLAVSAVQFATGYRADLGLLARACREREIILSVDVMQAAGWLRLDLVALGAGLVAAGASKWMSGPQGVGFAHVREDLLPRLRPAHFGIGAVARKESYFDYDPEPDATALRFEESVVSILDTTAFRASLSLLHEAGADALEDRVRALSHRLATGLSDLGCAIVGPWPRAPEHSSGIVSFRVPGIEAEAVLQALASQRIVGRTHRDFVRLSPHAWNTQAEIDRALEVVGSVRRQAMPRAIAPGSG